MIRPIHFSDGKAPLFGVLHEPWDTPRWAVVICPSWGMEYMRGYPGLRELAQLLARSGFAAFTFDYFATGDSAGDGCQATCERWLTDIGDAADEVRDASGAERVCILGLRLGALLAQQAVRTGVVSADALILWDAPTSGRHYVAEMRLLDELLNAEKNRQRAAQAQLPLQADDELLGHAWPDALAATIETLPDPTQVAYAGSRQPRFVYSRDSLAPSGVDVVQLPDPGAWSDPGKLTAPWLPATSVRALADHLTKWLV
jgi:alpha/beta superfamily hydrolase